jgi:hypothetical protein
MRESILDQVAGSTVLTREDFQTATSAVCHLGVIPENIELIIEIVEKLQQRTIHIYTRSQPLLQQLQQLELREKEIIPHLVEPAYPEQWIFRLSREISQKRIHEVVQYIPGILSLKKAPEQKALQKLAIRRLSLSCVYLDLSVLIAILQQVTPSRKEPFLFLSHFFDSDDLKDHAFFKNMLPYMQVSLIHNKDSNFKKVPLQTLKRRELFQVEASTEPVAEVKRKKKFALALPAQLSAHYQAHREHFPYRQFRNIETEVRRFRSRTKTQSQRYRLRLADAARRLKNQIGEVFRPSKSAGTLFVVCSLSPRKNKYIARIMGPMLQRLQVDREKCLFLINTQDETLLEDFDRALQHAVGQPHGVELLSMALLSDVRDLFQELFIANSTYADAAIFPAESLNRANNTLGSISSFKSLVTSLYYHAKGLEFENVMGREEDLEVVSILDLLKPALGKSYRTIILPSCLPEYSECYDFISVDDLHVSFDFVKDILVEQDINAKRVHVVGSLEWEEAHRVMELPESVKRLIQTSTFVLGVVHQPIFVTMHGQKLYNQLTMNFMDIYERFLERHPKAGLLIKPHPSDDLAALRQYFGKLERVEILPAEAPAQLFYDSIDAVISMHSTMMTHTLAHGIPVVSMYQYPDYWKMYAYMQKVGGCLVTDSHDEALAWLARLQEDPAFYAQIMAKTAAMKNHCLAVPASDKIASLMNAY